MYSFLNPSVIGGSWSSGFGGGFITAATGIPPPSGLLARGLFDGANGFIGLKPPARGLLQFAVL
jgi:hypothetical protein